LLHFFYLLSLNLFFKFSTTFVPNEDGDWELSLNVSGRANLFLDGKLVIDLSTNPEQSDSFFGLGTVDLKAIVPGLKAEQPYKLEIRLENADLSERGSPFRSWGGLRLGGTRKVNPEVELERAVEMAKDADGKEPRF
jgi:beta-glucosidase